jgi:membrane protease YdiL (CAAX protease family)
MPSTRFLLTYVLALFAVSWTFQLTGIALTGDISSEAATVWLVASMVSPLLVTLVFLRLNKNLRPWLLWKPSAKLLFPSLLAVLIPIGIAFGVLLMVQALGYGQSGWFDFTRSRVTVSGGPFLLGLGTQSWLVFTVNIVSTGAAFAILNAFIASGEEFAWRGLLQPLLTDQFGLVKGITLLGLIWSFWHLPALLNGYNYPETPVLGGFLLFPIRMVATSFFYAWLTVKSRSFIPAAIAHGAGNGIQQGIVSNLQLSVSALHENLLTIALTVLVGLIFLALLLRGGKTATSL